MRYTPRGRHDDEDDGTVDLAEHVPGTPQRYRHGWIPIDPLSPKIDTSPITAYTAGMLDGQYDKNLFDNAMQPLKKPVTLWRTSWLPGVESLSKEGRRAQIQKLINDKTLVHSNRYLSTSKVIEGTGTQGTTLKLKVLAGVGAIDAEPHADPAFKDQHEVILQRGTQLRLGKIVDDPKLGMYVTGTIEPEGYDPAAAARAKARTRTRNSLKGHDVNAKHVVDMWNQSTADEKAEGLGWYQSAHDVAEGFALKYGVTLHQAAGIIAVYSPQTGWGTNLIRAATVIRNRKGIGGKGSGVMATDKQRQVADRILAGEDYDDILKGMKINNFAHLIENGGNEPGRKDGRVVMDRHAIGVARGISMSEDQYTIDRPSSVKRYEMMSNAYRKAAKLISEQEGREISPHQVQAATWLARQRLNRSENRGASRNTRGVNDWNEWQQFAEEAGLDDGDAGTGYELSLEDEFDLDLAEPVTFEQEQAVAQQDVAVMQPPPGPDNDQLAQIVEVLLAGYLLAKTAGLLADIVPGISIDVWKAALTATGSKTRARPLVAKYELTGGPGEKIAKNAARSEAYYRAAYIAKAAERIQADVDNGDSIPEALLNEAKVLKTHEAARNNRLNAAGRAGKAAGMFGNLLGWYLNPLLDNEPECIAANGNNFEADKGTVIGFPGGVHLNCGCTAGPPIAGAGMVNDAIARAHNVIFQTPRRYGLKAS